MKAEEYKLLEFLKLADQFVIPIYQRTYSWETSQCQQLWNDIIRAGSNDEVYGHFIGSFVYIEAGLYAVGDAPLEVIDGQQRITTIFLLIEAFARLLGSGEQVDGFGKEKLKKYFLINDLEERDKKYKLLLNEPDRRSLNSLIDGSEWPNNTSIRIKDNFNFFSNQIEKLDDNNCVIKGLQKLIVVGVSLDRNKDNPQRIFESMNSLGLRLQQGDLIRNYILLGLDRNEQKKIYLNYWKPMEELFGQEGYRAGFDRFMRDYLTLKTGTTPSFPNIYEHFKEHFKADDMDKLTKEIRKFAEYYCAIRYQKEEDSQLKRVFTDFKDLNVNVADPLFLYLYQEYDNGRLPKDELIKIVLLVESYVFRRSACDIPTNSMNKTFANMTRMLSSGNESLLKSVQEHFLKLQAAERHYTRFPTDQEFKEKLVMDDIYNKSGSFKDYLMSKLENHDRKEFCNTSEYTIEHIMPQGDNLPPEWKDELGENWEEIHAKYRHTLGNLTLTGYNSEYSNKPFADKRDMKNGFKDSPQSLNEHLRHAQKWDEEAIKSRAEALAEKSIKIWVGLSET